MVRGLATMGGRQHRPTQTRTPTAPPWAYFVGRERELEELTSALTAASAGRGCFALVAGESGIGKTALVGAVAERAAAEDVRVVWGRCWEGGGAPPFWPWGRIVDELSRGRDREWLERELGGGARRLGLIAPELGERLNGEPPESAPKSEQGRFAQINSLAAFLRATASEQPLLLALDDVHAAGTDALLALEFVSRELRDAPLLGLATFQSEALRRRPEAEPLVAGLARTCRRIDLGGLSGDEVGAMLEQVTGAAPAPGLVDAVNALAAGNPFFAGEVVRTLAAEGRLPDQTELSRIELPLPSGVRDAVGRRIMSLPGSAQEVLAAASVIGRDFRLATLERATGMGRTDLLAVLDDALEAGLVVHGRPAATSFGFAHGLVRETIYKGLSTVERGHLHARVGDAIEQIYEGEIEAHLAELAHHFFEAAIDGDPAKAVTYSTRAGQWALRALAWDEAARLFEQSLAALELGGSQPETRAELLVELGRAEVHSGDAEARATLRTAAASATEVGRPDLLARAALDFGAFALSPGIVDEELVRLLEQALDALDPSDSALRARVLARLAVALYWSPQVDRRLALADEAVAMARRIGDRATRAYTLANKQAASASPDRTEECVEMALELFRLSDSRWDLELELPARVRQVGYLLELDDLAGSDIAIETLERLAADSHDPRAQAYVPLERSRRNTLEGLFDEAERLTAEAGRLGARLRDSTIPMQTAAQVIGIRWAQGRLREMRADLKGFADRYPAMPVFRAAFALASYEDGRDADARRELRLLAAHDFDDIPRDIVWLLAMAFLSETAAQLEDAEAAAVLYRLFAPFEGRNVTSPDAIFAGPVARYLGLLAAAQGERASAERHFLAAWGQASLDRARPAMVRVRLDHARMLLDSGSPAERARASELLDEAQAGAEELGLESLLEWIAAAREGSGPRPARAGQQLEARLYREGDVWRIDFDGRAIHMRDSKGVRHLAVLLGAPGVEIPAGDVEAGAVLQGNHSAALAHEAGLAVQAAPDAPLAGLDETAKEEYRRRLEDLREEVAQAEAWGDPERAARAREEMDMIGAELAAAVGLGGRDRPLASGAERARVRVTRAIHAAIKRIGELDEGLGYELGATIHTGSFCSYEPDPRRPVTWQIDGG
jgi:AAA ATPase domain